MVFLVLGLNHQTAPITIREQWVFDPDRIKIQLAALQKTLKIKAALLLSTCNRTELYCTLETDLQEASKDENRQANIDLETKLEKNIENIVEWFLAQSSGSLTTLQGFTYLYRGERVIQHLMRVASGLDSMVIGESEILGQLKKAYQLALEVGSLDTYFKRVFEAAFSAAKNVRSKTKIGQNPLSIASIAVNYARHVFSEIKSATVLLIGAGELIQQTAMTLKNLGVQHLLLANRSSKRGQELGARLGCEIISEAELGSRIQDADIVITGTHAPLPIIGKGMVERAVKLRKRRPMVMLDLSVPRNIEPEVGDLEDVYLYCIDDLKSICEENTHHRKQAANYAEKIIEEELEKFKTWQDAQVAFRHIENYRKKCEAFRDKIYKECQQKLHLGESSTEVLQQALYRLTNYFMHDPTLRLKSAKTHESENETESEKESELVYENIN